MNLKKLDKVFSIYIRRRFADELGFVKCATCPDVSHWSQIDCGHFRLRGNLAVRWDEHDAAQQCRICNGPGEGEYVKMKAYLISKFGEEAIDDVIVKSRTTWKPMQFEIDELIEHFKSKLKEL